MANSGTASKILSPKVGFLLMFGMAAGAVVGPWLVQMSWWVSLTGSSLVLGVIATGILLIPIAFCYGELGSMLPFAGGEYTYARHAYGDRVAWWVGWLTILLYVTAVSFMSMAVVWVFKAVVFPEMPYYGSLLIAIGVALLFTLINVYSIRLSAGLQLAMTVILVVIGLVIAILFLTSAHWTIDNWKPFFAKGISGWFVAIGMLVIMYTGFDAIVQMVEEANYPRRQHVWVMLGAILLIMVFYIIIISGNSGMKPTSWISEQELVSYTIVKEFWGSVPAAFIGVAAILATLTTLNALLIAGIRTVFAVARGGWLPKGLSHVSKRDVPDYATWFVFILAMVILLASGQKWLEAIMTVAALTAGLIYVFVPVAALVLRKKHPQWTRPYKMPGWMGILATIFGLVILVATITGTPPIGWLIFAIFVAIGIIIFAWMLYKHATDENYSSLKALSPEDIPVERE